MSRLYWKTTLIGLLLLALPAWANDPIIIVLNHDCPFYDAGGYINYEPVKEVGFVLHPNIVVTKDQRDCNFPDDAFLEGSSSKKLWVYLIDYDNGVKVFLSEKSLALTDNLAPGAQWYLQWAIREIGKDGLESKSIEANIQWVIGKFRADQNRRTRL